MNRQEPAPRAAALRSSGVEFEEESSGRAVRQVLWAGLLEQLGEQLGEAAQNPAAAPELPTKTTGTRRGARTKSESLGAFFFQKK